MPKQNEIQCQKRFKLTGSGKDQRKHAYKESYFDQKIEEA